MTPGLSLLFGCVPLDPLAWLTVAGWVIGATGLAWLIENVAPAQ
jgi:hypothetical protein